MASQHCPELSCLTKFTLPDFSSTNVPILERCRGGNCLIIFLVGLGRHDICMMFFEKRLCTKIQEIEVIELLENLTMICALILCKVNKCLNRSSTY